MKAKEGVLDNLNKILKAELTAVHQYLLHAGLCKNWGYMRLHHEFAELAEGEVKHASQLIDQILYLDGVPDTQHLEAVAAGGDVKQLFVRDLEFEKVMRTCWGRRLLIARRLRTSPRDTCLNI
jgi:bacterioferritin